MIKMGILGGGYWGKNIVRNLLKIPEVEVAVVGDPHPETRRQVLEQFPGIRCTGDPEAILSDDAIDAVAVITPPSLHYLPAKKALEAEKHVFVEKPMAMSYEEGKELLSLAEEKGKVLFVDETFLYDPALHLVRDLINTGEIGPVQHVLSERLGMGRIRCESNVWWNSAPHDLSILRFILPQRVEAVAVTGKAFLQEGIEDVTMGILEMEEGISAFVHLSWCHPKSTAALTIIGQRGAIFYEGRFANRHVVLYRYEFGQRPKEEVWGVPSPNFIPAKATEERVWRDFGPTEPLYASLEAFVRAIQEGYDAPSLGKYSLETLKVLEAGQRSLKAGGERISLRS